MDLSSIEFHTYGCKVNSYDTGLLQKQMAQVESQWGDKEVHIINTCAVTHEATREAIRGIRKIKKKQPESIVVVTGCSAQVDTEFYQELKEADLVVANSHKSQISDLLGQFIRGENPQRISKSNIFKIEELGAGGGINSSLSRSFLKIQDGCNSFCTYCVIPFARGKSRSIPIDQIVDKVDELYEQGIREVVVTGIHIGDYEDLEFGDTRKRGLEDLLEQLLIRTKMPRFRVSSLEPPELTPRLLELYGVDRMCPHFHMSIQSATDSVLKNMKRQYLSSAVEDSLKSIKEKVPQAFVGMDVIVGFPGESHEDFMETYERLNSLPWSKIHVFPYSERPNTYAQRLNDKVPQHEVYNRSRFLRRLSRDRLLQAAAEQVGSVKLALPLVRKKEDEGQFISRDFWNIRIKSEKKYEKQQELSVKITDFYAEGDKVHLIGVN